MQNSRLAQLQLCYYSTFIWTPLIHVLQNTQLSTRMHQLVTAYKPCSLSATIRNTSMAGYCRQYVWYEGINHLSQNIRYAISHRTQQLNRNSDYNRAIDGTLIRGALDYSNPRHGGIRSALTRSRQSATHHTWQPCAVAETTYISVADSLVAHVAVPVATIQDQTTQLR